MRGVSADGYFKFSKLGPLVTVGSEDGPVADATILAQVFAGRSPDALRAIGDPLPFIRGRIFNTLMDVPFMVPGTTAYLQFAAWDSKSWGLSYSGVPLGGSAVSSITTTELEIPNSEAFIQIAFPEKMVVPTSVPEPEEWAMLLMGGAACSWWGRGREKVVERLKSKALKTQPRVFAPSLFLSCFPAFQIQSLWPAGYQRSVNGTRLQRFGFVLGSLWGSRSRLWM